MRRARLRQHHRVARLPGRGTGCRSAARCPPPAVRGGSRSCCGVVLPLVSRREHGAGAKAEPRRQRRSPAQRVAADHHQDAQQQRHQHPQERLFGARKDRSLGLAYAYCPRPEPTCQVLVALFAALRNDAYALGGASERRADAGPIIEAVFAAVDLGRAIAMIHRLAAIRARIGVVVGRDAVLVAAADVDAVGVLIDVVRRVATAESNWCSRLRATKSCTSFGTSEPPMMIESPCAH